MRLVDGDSTRVLTGVDREADRDRAAAMLRHCHDLGRARERRTTPGSDDDECCAAHRVVQRVSRRELDRPGPDFKHSAHRRTARFVVIINDSYNARVVGGRHGEIDEGRVAAGTGVHRDVGRACEQRRCDICQGKMIATRDAAPCADLAR